MNSNGINPLSLAENDALRAQVSELTDRCEAMHRALVAKDQHASLVTQFACALVLALNDERGQMQGEGVLLTVEDLDRARDFCFFRLRINKLRREAEDGHDAELVLEQLTGDEAEKWAEAKARAAAGETPPKAGPKILGIDGEPIE